MSVHLNVRSCYTLLESTITIPKLIQKTIEYGYQSVALTDHNVMYGIPLFLHLCKEKGIRPIIGLEADIQYHDTAVPFLLLAKDNKGYAQLMQLSSQLNEDAKSADLAALNACAEHCFIIAYGEGGWLDSDLIREDQEQCIAKLKIMKEEISAFDIALSYQEAAMWKKRNQFLKRVCMNLGIHTCALNKISCLQEEDNKVCQVMNGIRLGKTIHDPSLLLPTGRYFRTPQEMAALYEKDDLDRTDEIAKECNADGNLAKTSLPSYQVPKEGVSSQEYLTALCLTGLKKRLQGRMDPKYAERLKYELSVICKMHYEDYFLIVFDFIRHARKNGINVGPGRGSAVGSLVAYSLGITMIDPMQYHLLFERFLNPERVSMPDIDTDIPDDRREEVIQYVYDTYGRDKIAGIVTFNTFGAKKAIFDTGKVMNLNTSEVNMVLRHISGEKATLKSAYQSSSNLRQIINSSEKLHALYAMALKLEGLPRNTGTHAAGIIMSSKPLSAVIPTLVDEKGHLISQYTMEYLEERGLIKMDFLGLKNLRIINDIVVNIQKEHPAFKLSAIPLNDPSVYQVFAAVDTTGIFQFDSETIKPMLRVIQPNCFADIVAANALNRPGPSANISVYLKNRKNPAAIQYPSKELKEILQETYGVMIYQEQVMLATQKCAGFSLGKADILRRAMSKKKQDLMASMHQEFVNGCMQNHYSKETAEKLFEYIEKFSGYGFNKSHSVAYALIAYQLAYLKVKYPMYFYSGLLNSVINDKEKTSQYVDECRRRGMKVLQPDVNASQEIYFGSQNSIRLPLSAIGEVYRTGIGNKVIQEREEHGPYLDYFDFIARAVMLKMKRSQIEAMIDAGALDCFQIGRSTCRHALDDAMRYAELVQIHSGDQISINLGLVSKPEFIRIKDDETEISENERNALGFNLGPHPIIAVRRNHKITDPSLAALKGKNGRFNGFAMINSVKPHRTKRGDMMAFVTLSDETGQADMAVMPNLYQQKASILVRGMFIRFNVKIEDGKSFLANEIVEIRKK